MGECGSVQRAPDVLFCIEKPKGTLLLQSPGWAPEASWKTDSGAKTAQNNLQFWRFGKSKENLLKDYTLCTVGIDHGCRFWAEDREKKGFRDDRWWLLKKYFNKSFLCWREALPLVTKKSTLSIAVLRQSAPDVSAALQGLQLQIIRFTKKQLKYVFVILIVYIL